MTALSSHQINYDEAGLGFDFDSSFVEFDAGIGVGNSARLKKLANVAPEILYASIRGGFSVDRDVNSNASVIPVGTVFLENLTPINAGAIQNQYITMGNDIAGNYTAVAGSSLANITSKFSIRYKHIPHYSVKPVGSEYMFTLVESAGPLNWIINIKHSKSDGRLYFQITNSVGTVISNILGSVWSPTAETEYEIQLNVSTEDCRFSLFIDGVDFFRGTYTAITRAVTSNTLIMGSYYGALTTKSHDMSFRDLQVFDDEINVAGDDFSALVPRVIPIYFAGAKLASPSAGQEIITDSIVGGFADLESLLPNTSISFLTKYKGIDYWYNGTGWVVSNGLFAESNTVDEMNTNIDNFYFSDGGTVTFPTFLFSVDGLNTPSLENIKFSFDFYGVKGGYNKCIVYGHVSDNSGNIETGGTVTFSSKPFANDGDILAINETFTMDERGYVEILLVSTDIVTGERDVDTLVKTEINYTDLSGKKHKIKGNIVIPNKAQARLGDLLA